jgi:hypothetical protein
MSIFRNDPPVLIRPPGYQVDLDRLQPVRGASCGRVALMLIAFVAILGVVCGGVFMFIRAQTMPASQNPALLTLVATRPPVTAVATNSAALDAWSLTGTALLYVEASPTLDYCWWQTPTAIPSATPVPVTPDAWALEGTARALETGTPTHTPMPTQQPPRAWCDLQTATFTPFPLPARPEGTQEVAAAPLPSATPEPTKNPTVTPFPEIKAPAPQPAGNVPVAQSNPEPIVIVQTEVVVIVQTAVPAAPQVVIVTATHTPTFTATATHTPTATETATETLTATPTETPTATFTPTETATATATFEPTATEIPSEIPPEVTQDTTP